MTARELRNIHVTGKSCKGTVVAQHGTKATTVFIPIDGEASFLLLSLVFLVLGSRVQPENTNSCILKVTHSLSPHLYEEMGGVDFLYFGNKSEDEIFFLEREGLN